MWDRQLKEVEAGTHRRDKMRVKLKREREREREEMLADAAAQNATMVPQTAAAPPERARASTPPTAAANANGSNGGMSEEKMRRLYSVYMQAKKRTGEASNLSFESLAAQLRKQVPAIRAKHNCEQVDFKVVLKNGKAMLKAVPK